MRSIGFLAKKLLLGTQMVSGYSHSKFNQCMSVRRMCVSYKFPLCFVDKLV